MILNTSRVALSVLSLAIVKEEIYKSRFTLNSSIREHRTLMKAFYLVFANYIVLL